jgi:hypothetical protein
MGSVSHYRVKCLHYTYSSSLLHENGSQIDSEKRDLFPTMERSQGEFLVSRPFPPIEISEAILGASRGRRLGELATLLGAIDERTIERSAIFKSKGPQIS